MKERIDEESGWKIEQIVNLLRCKCNLIINDPIDLEKKSFWCFFDPALLLNSDDLSFFISIIINVRYSDLFTCFIELLIFNVYKE